jgi:hypothetical protein
MERPIPTATLLRTHRAHIDKIHAQVGLLLQVEAERSGGTEALMTPERLLQVVDAVLAEDGIDRARREELAEQVVCAAKDRLVFLVEMRQGRVGFEIRSLQEFMAAWALSSKSDGLVEQRLRQVAKAASFRNVVLFVASRCFTELNDLRSAFTDRLCPWMNNDPDDALARAACAGSVLALELLDEGSALNQPLYARRLMDLAVKLIDTPPSALHAQLARVGSNPDIEAVLRPAIEARMAQGTTTEQLGAWITLARLADEQKAWAKELAEAQWPATEKDQGAIAEGLFDANPERNGGAWIWSWIAAAPEHMPPLAWQHPWVDGGAKFPEFPGRPAWMQAISEIFGRGPQTRLEIKISTTILEVAISTLVPVHGGAMHEHM